MKRETEKIATCYETRKPRRDSREELYIRANGGAELFDDPRLAPFCRIVGGKLAIREAQALDRCEKKVTAATYYLIALILVRVAGNFLESWQQAGYALNQKAYNVASHYYNRAAFAMRQASLAELYAQYSKASPAQKKSARSASGREDKQQ